jgi:hypothetical protein
MKTIVQVYKSPQCWKNGPPGLGDFIRGICHLYELLHNDVIALRVDIGQSDFFQYVEWDETFFFRGENYNVCQAEEFFVDHVSLLKRIELFKKSDEKLLFISTNFGDWNRTCLSFYVVDFVSKFYNFKKLITTELAKDLTVAEYEVLSVRCGDVFFGDPAAKISDKQFNLVCTIIERTILIRSKYPIVITSDSYALKCELARRYNMLILPYQSQHGAYGDMSSVALDLCMLKNAKFIYHINLWATWWSGFSHYTSLIFNIPSMNFRAPDFAIEEVMPQYLLPDLGGGMNNNLEIAVQLINEKNYPQAELYVRDFLNSNQPNDLTTNLLQQIGVGYGFCSECSFSEKSTHLETGKKYLFIRAWGYGFWSDVHHVLGQLLVSELTGRIPVVWWGGNSLYSKFENTNAFRLYFQSVCEEGLPDSLDGFTFFPCKWNKRNLYGPEINTWQGHDSRVSALYFLNRPEDILVSDFYTTLASIIPWISSDSAFYGLSEDQIYAWLMKKYLKPISSISNKVDDFYQCYMAKFSWLAVHVRGSDKVNESADLLSINNEYYGVVDSIIHTNPEVKLFLLTDSTSILDGYTARYGERVLSTNAMRSDSDIGVHLQGGSGFSLGEEIMIDVYLAIRCNFFVGNQESNVSVAISSLKLWQPNTLFLMGASNVRSTNWFLHKNHRPIFNGDSIVSDRSIKNIHLNKTGKVSDKWESYLDYYDFLFLSLRDSPVALLEIGVQNGGSLETWAAYFGKGRLFLGCDIDPKCSLLKYDDPRINVLIGNIVSTDVYQKVTGFSPVFEIIIDDGSHVSTDVINAFVNYFPLLAPGGIYVVEDAHTLYNDGFGGGIMNDYGAYAFFKKLVDVVSFEFWRDQVSLGTYFRTFFSLSSLPVFINDGWIDSIEFRNSLVIIRKAKSPGHSKLGQRILTGTEALVQNWGGGNLFQADPV